jgi:hypothetical protein
MLSALAFQAQFDKVLPELAELHFCILWGFIGHPQNRKTETRRLRKSVSITPRVE